jgi:hypothetical protein
MGDDGVRVRGKATSAKGEAKGLEHLHLVTYAIESGDLRDHGAVFFNHPERTLFPTWVFLFFVLLPLFFLFVSCLLSYTRDIFYLQTDAFSPFGSVSWFFVSLSFYILPFVITLCFLRCCFFFFRLRVLFPIVQLPAPITPAHPPQWPLLPPLTATTTATIMMTTTTIHQSQIKMTLPLTHADLSPPFTYYGYVHATRYVNSLAVADGGCSVYALGRVEIDGITDLFVVDLPPVD